MTELRNRHRPMIRTTAVKLCLLVWFALGLWTVGGVEPIAGVAPAVAAHNELEEHSTPTPEATEAVAEFPDDAEIVDAETALNEMNAKNEAIKREYPQLAKVDNQAFSGGNLDQRSGAPNGDNFGRVTPSRLGRGNTPGGIQNMTNQLMQQAFQSMMKQKPSGGGSQSGQGKQAAKKPAQNQPAQKQPSTASDEVKLTPTPEVTVTAAQTPEATATPAASKTETPGATPTPAGTKSAADQLLSTLSASGPTPTPRPVMRESRPVSAGWRPVSSSAKNPYRF